LLLENSINSSYSSFIGGQNVKLRNLCYLILLVMCSSAFAQQPATDPAFAKIDQVFGQNGKGLPGNVQKYSWPRSDLHVSVGGVPIETGLALGSWAAFQKSGNDVMTMGDLVLLPSEVNPVISQLQAGGIDILAVHNHLINETPQVIYVHFEGHGAPEAIANSLKAALAKTKTPAPSPAKPAAKLTPDEEKSFATIQGAFGQKGNVAGKVLQIGIPRAEKIEDNKMEIPPSMGMSESMNFQEAAGKISASGDFVLTSNEVNPVIKELQDHGIQVTALHTHMLNDSPHLFFMHFWASGSAEEVAAGLKAALSRVNIKK
jgi:biotin operon repressor